MKQLVPLIFLFVFLGLLLGSNYYLSRRIDWYFNLESPKTLFITFCALCLYMIAGLMAFSNTTSQTLSFLYTISALIMGIFLYSLLAVLVVDLLALFTNFSPKTYGTIALSISLLVSVYGIFNAWNVKVTQQQIEVKGLSKKIRAMHLTDIHLGHFRGKKFLQNLVDKTNAANVDLVVITGDLFDGKINLSPETLAPLSQLKVPIYFVEGNHDGYSGVKTIKQYLRQLNVHVLENEIKNFGDLQIIGLNHMLADPNSVNMHASSRHLTIKEVLEKLRPDKNKPSLLLHHSPDGIQYANKSGVDVYLAGHTHAGQLFPINFIANLIFAYNKGLHDFNGTKLFVSQGAGTFGPPMRVGIDSEITVINLIPNK